MITVKDVLENQSYKEEIGKTINSLGWSILMDVAKNNMMRPPDPRVEKLNFQQVDPNHIAPILYGISIGKWELVDLLSNMHFAEDIVNMNPIEETYGAGEILKKENEGRLRKENSNGAK